jgi:phospholipase/carboxylesterase
LTEEINRLGFMSTSITKFVSGGLDSLSDSGPVILFLHGYGADERDLPELMSYLPELPWFSPRAPLASQYSGFSWYSASELVSPTVEEVQQSTEVLWDWIDQYVPEKTKLILIGFSQGGLMATQLLRTRPKRIQGTVILAGFMASGELAPDSELVKSRPKVIYARGLEDQAIPKASISQLNTWLQLNTRAVTKTYAGLAHSVDSRVMEDVAVYVSGQLS